MSHIDAPLYVHAHDLAVALTSCTLKWSPTAVWVVGAALVAAAMDLTCRVAEALTFPALRSEQLAAADAAVNELRMRMRVAEAVGLLDAPAAQRHGEALVVIGRMLGGWRKRCAERAAETADGHPAE